ncbi:MAG: EamA family transporter, partial [Candidatus Norongarragalinales archaeon]
NYIVLFSFIQALTLAGVIFWGYKPPQPWVAAAGLAAGATTFFSYIAYAKAMQAEEASRVSLLTQLTPLFTLLLAFTFLGERLNTTMILAFALLLASGLIASIKPIQGRPLKPSPAILVMLFVTFLYAVSAVLAKLVFTHQEFWDGFVEIRLGILAAALAFLSIKPFRQKFLREARSLPRKSIAAAVSVSAGDVAAAALSQYAIMLGPVSVIAALSGLTPFFVIAIAAALSIKFPQAMKEEVTPSALAFKATAAALAASGLWLLATA